MFVNASTHQLRTPLSGIESMIELAKPYMSDSQGLYYLEVAQMSAINIRHIVDDTIILAQNDQSKIALELLPLNIRNIVDELAAIFKFEADMKALTFKIDIKGDNVGILADRKKLIHILYTMLSNAFKYTAQGGIQFCIVIERVDRRVFVDFIVKDTGSGISFEDKENIFRIFQNAEYQIKTKKASTGFGLYIARKICKAMNGKIKYESEIGVGTTFTASICFDITEAQN